MILKNKSVPYKIIMKFNNLKGIIEKLKKV